ncbi:hypothetical protein AB0P21_26970 [Kribbella sp. NPDC056861]|uniref:hypothetical protein n=1 Tax=Kribbella sp. NPDC056861 TaxID=3154857 RepID=UPI0034231DC3
MGRKRKAERSETFADIVEEVTAATSGPAGPPIVWCQPIEDGEYVDEADIRWELRGGELPWKRIERLFRDPHVRVLRAYQDEIRDVAVEDRARFAAMIRPYLDGTLSREVGDFTDFEVGEFKDDQHRSLLFVEVSC